MSEPLNVWFSDGREYTDYRLPDGCIVTIETTPITSAEEEQ